MQVQTSAQHSALALGEGQSRHTSVCSTVPWALGAVRAEGLTWQQHGALALGGGHSQLVKGHDLATSLQDPAAGASGHLQSTDLQREESAPCQAHSYQAHCTEHSTNNVNKGPSLCLGHHISLEYFLTNGQLLTPTHHQPVTTALQKVTSARGSSLKYWVKKDKLSAVTALQPSSMMMSHASIQC